MFNWWLLHILAAFAVFFALERSYSYTQRSSTTTGSAQLLSSSASSSLTMSEMASSVTSSVKTAATAAAAKLKRLPPTATITPHRSAERGHSDHGWLNTYHSFSFADWYDPRFTSFGSLRVLNEDRVAPRNGFPTHPHRDFEIFSYIISGELTHRDSMVRRGSAAEASAGADQFFRMHRGDVQFTTGGTGIAHSETNEHARDTVHFLQIWAVPWRRGLPPTYHTAHFGDADKQAAAAAAAASEARDGGFVPILSPLVGGPEASAADEAAAKPKLPGTIPIHADFAMGAALIAPGEGSAATWTVGLGQPGVITQAARRKVYVHLPMTTKSGRGARIRLGGGRDSDGENAVLSEGDGAFVDRVAAGDKLTVENIGTEQAEVVVLDTA